MVDRFRRPGQSQVVTIAVLCVIIAAAVGLSIYMMTRGGKPEDKEGFRLHYWCIETQKAYEIDPLTLPEETAMRVLEWHDTTARLKNPDTGKDTLVMMWECPSCHKPFMPDALKTGQSVAPGTFSAVCPHCQTDFNKYQSDNRPGSR